MEKNVLCLIATTVAILALPVASATELGVNYYHESMMGTWGSQYVPRTIGQVSADLDHMRQLTRHVKVYMNPFVEQNLGWIEQVSSTAKSKGFHVAVNMMVDDRQLSDGNWWDYTNRVVQACSRLSGKVDSVLVGNELTLHSPWDKWEERRRIEPLIERCKQTFSGEVSYEGFWYTKEAWYDYPGKIYFMFYENYDTFQTNVNEFKQRFGSRAIVGEFGEDIRDESVTRDHNWQREQIERRWKAIEGLGFPVAYAFSYREPSWNGFGLVHGDRTETPAWQYLESVKGSSVPSAPTCTPTTEVCDGRDNDCDGRVDENACTVSSATGIAKLPVSCSGGCTKLSDVTSGVCRTVRYQLSAGTVQAQACEKGGGWYEAYRQQAPSGASFQVCFANGCVNKDHGFSRFQVSSTVTPTTSPASALATSETTLSSLPFVAGPSAAKASDVTYGTCRTVSYSTSKGPISAKACDKEGDRYEMYLLTQPNGASVCVSGNCVGSQTGFASFIA